MIQLPGYTLGPQVFRSATTAVYRGTREDGTSVVIKTPATRPTSRERERYAHAWAIGRQFTGDPGVVQHLALETETQTLALVTEDFGGQALDRLAGAGGLGLRTLLRIAIDVTRALGAIHQRNVIHKDISPGNIAFCPDTGVTKLLDFSISSQLSREKAALAGERRIEGTLAYLSPERTGRMNRPVDYRSDFYSLGATLYHLLTGTLPFEGSDPLELIHAHIARTPLPAAERDHNVPKPVSDLVGRLLEKTPERRYRSAYGIRRDLEACLASLEEQGQVQPFQLGAHDFDLKLNLPHKLFGRAAEIERLTRAVTEAGGPRQVFLVGGQPGIGKSALVGEVHKPLAARRGAWCSGKFDQFRRDLPYLAIRDAVSDLLRQRLEDEPDAVSRLSNRLKSSLGDGAGVLTAVVPELCDFVGEMPAPPEVGPSEARVRFDRQFRLMMRELVRPDKPLVLFLDDLQWADLPSLHLLAMLGHDPSLAGLVVVGAYRDNEAGPTHPLWDTVRTIENAGVPVDRMVLGPLSTDSVAELCAEALSREPDTVHPLAELVFQKTGGNPFFVNAFLKGVYDAGALDVDATNGRWTWDLEKARAIASTENVIHLVTGRLRDLPPETLAILQAGSCIGASFDLATVADVSRMGKAKAVAALHPALEAELVVPLDDDYKYVSDTFESGTGGPNPRFAFFHDRVQQAAHELLDEAREAELHLALGAHGLTLEPEALGDSLVNVVNHLNLATGLISPDQRVHLAQLNLAAGRRAASSLAFEAANAYLDAGLKLLPEGHWSDEPSLSMGLHVAAANAAVATNRYDEMDKLADAALANARTPLEQAAVQGIRIRAFMSRNRPTDAVAAGLAAMEQLGERFPASPNQGHVVLGLILTQRRLGNLDRLADLPTMTDERALAAMEVLMSMTSPVYFTAPDLFPLVIYRMVDLSLAHGNCGLSSYGYGVFGMILCGATGDHEPGYALGRLSQTLLERYDAQPLVGKIAMVFHGFIRHWSEPIEHSLPDLRTGFTEAMEQGDAEYAAYCAAISFYYSLFCGKELGPLLQRYAPYAAEIRATGQAQAVPLIGTWMQAATQLAGSDWRQVTLSGDHYVHGSGEGTDTARYTAKGNLMAVFMAHTAQGWLAFLLGDVPLAWRELTAAEAHQDTVLANAVNQFHELLQALAACALLRRSDRTVSWWRLRFTITRNLRRLKAAAKYAPANATHRIALVEAELFRSQRRFDKAVAAYQRAIAGAQSSGFLHEEALAYELLAGAYTDRQLHDLARPFLTEARRLYRRWGAEAKAGSLEAEHNLLTGPVLSDHNSGSPSNPVSTATYRDEDLDVLTVLKSSRALSAELDTDGLLARLIALAMENAGATRGLLILDEEGRGWTVRAERVLEGEPLCRGTESLADVRDRVPHTLVQMVQRSHEAVRVADAIHDDRFLRDPYVIAHQPRSIVAMPVVRQGELRGVVLLEHGELRDAFSPNTEELLRVLCGQLAVSYDNAQLFARQKALGRAFARFVPDGFLRQLGHRSVTDATLGDGVHREITVMFSDLRGFTPLVESLGAKRSFEFINQYLARMAPAIHRNAGLVRGFYGDGIMALFPGSADDAVKAVLGMIEALDAYNEERAERGEPPLDMGFGLHTGPLMLGIIGSTTRMEAAVVGDAANLAARLEGMTKPFGARVLLSDATRSRLETEVDRQTRLRGVFKVKGKSHPVTVWELLDAAPPCHRDPRVSALDRWNEAMAAYDEQKFARAAELFAQVHADDPDDAGAEYWSERCVDLAMGPVAPDFDGIETLTWK